MVVVNESSCNVEDIGSIGSVPISRVGGSDSSVGNERSMDDSLRNDGSVENNSLNSFSKTAASKSPSRY